MQNDAKSSLHIEAGKIHTPLHNSRSIPTENAIFSDEKNEYDVSGKQAIQRYQQLLIPRIEAYTKRTGQKLQKNVITHLSAIVNTKQKTSMEELQKLARYLEYILGTKVFQICIHRDEGHVKDGHNIKNYHAHLEMLGLDENGYSIRRKLTRAVLSQLQDKTAEILQMTRGTNYIKRKKKRARRLGTYEYKRAMEMVEKAVETVKKEFNTKIQNLQNQLNAATANKKAADNAFLELMLQLKLKDPQRKKPYSYSEVKDLILHRFAQAKEALNQLQEQNNTYVSHLNKAKKMLLDYEQKNLDLRADLEKTQQQLESSITKNNELEHKIKMLKTFSRPREEDEDYDDEIGMRL